MAHANQSGGIFYGWWIVTASALAIALNLGLYNPGLTNFLVPLSEQFGWSRAATGGAFSAANLVGGLIAASGGYIADRIGVRRVMFFGIALMGAGYLVLSQIQSLLAFFIVVTLMLSVGAMLGTLVPAMVSTANWFYRKRGRALGLAMSGAGIGGLLLPLMAFLIGEFGWRTAAVIGGCTIWAVGFPLAAVMRHRPEDYGMLPDGAIAPELPVAGEPIDTIAEPAFTLRQALHTHTFWLLTLAFGLRQIVISGTLVHMIPALTEIGMSRQIASFTLGSVGIASIAGRIGFGWIADRMAIDRVMQATLLLLGISALIFAAMTSPWGALPFVAVFAPAYGGGVALMFAIRAEYFGRASFGAISGFMDFTQIFGLATGPFFAGAMFDLTGSYRWAFVSFAAFTMLSLLALRGAARAHRKYTAAAVANSAGAAIPT